MKAYMLNRLDKQKAVYEVDYSTMTFRLVSMDAHGADRLHDIKGKFKLGQFSPDIFMEVEKPR